MPLFVKLKIIMFNYDIIAVFLLVLTGSLVGMDFFKVKLIMFFFFCTGNSNHFGHLLRKRILR